MKSFVTAFVLVAFVAAPALAGQCPMLQAQVDKAVGNRFDPGAANARQIAAQADALHKSGKHAESVAELAKAQKILGVTPGK